MKYVATIIAALMSLSAQAELSKEVVERWVHSLQPVQTWVENNGDKINKHDLLRADAKGMSGMFDNALAELERVGLKESFTTTITKQGYTSAEHWAAESSEVTLAYLAVSMQGKVPSREALEQQLAQVSASQLPQAQKQMMQDMLKGTLSMLDDVQTVSDSDKALISPYIEKISGHLKHGH